MRSAWLVITSFVVFTLVAYLGFHFAAPAVKTQSPSVTPEDGNTEQPRIVLIHDEPELPPGPGRAQFATDCVICHSPRYISMQPPFPREVWEAEVHKMVTMYGAPISESDQAQIVNYLSATFGAKEGNK
jgi:mono/diheme cytochrome c family protein